MSLRDRLAQDTPLLAPGAYDALSALLVEQAGFEAIYLSGASIAYTQLGRPDIGLVSFDHVADVVGRVAERVSLPLIVDGDTGFGNAVNVSHTVRTLERAGADAIQLEDQVFPKRCGHFNGKDVAPLGEMIGKIKAAVDARTDSNFLIVARTDARSVHGFDAAVERAARMAEAGADLLFVEATESVDEVRKLPALLPLPQVMNIVIGGKTPQLPQSELAELGFGLVLYANTALQGAVLGMQRALGELQAKGILREDPNLVIPFMERQRLVDKPRFDAMEKHYAQGD